VLDFRPGRGNKLHFNTRSLPATYTGKLYGRDAEVKWASVFATRRPSMNILGRNQAAVTPPEAALLGP
jgi:hypothetical protein